MCQQAFELLINEPCSKGGGGDSTGFYNGRFRPTVQPLFPTVWTNHKTRTIKYKNVSVNPFGPFIRLKTQISLPFKYLIH